MKESEVRQMVAENVLRNRKLVSHYDPISGREATGQRVETTVQWEEGTVWLPESMVKAGAFSVMRSRDAYLRLRFLHDFEFWCATCVNVRQKLSGRIAPFILNAPQRRVLAMMEELRLGGKPIRLILLKARQWGGSALCYLLIYLKYFH